MQVEGVYIAETIKFVEHVRSIEYLLIKIVRAHQHNTNSTQLQTTIKFKKSFPSKKKSK